MTEKMRKILHGSARDDWGTPTWLFKTLHAQYNFTLDLCATERNALLPRFCQNVQSGMLIDLEWSDSIPIDWSREVFFCNPPYGRQWPKILEVIPKKSHGLFLLPSRTGSRWFQKMLQEASWVTFLKGRLIFKGAADAAPFDSVIFGYNIPPANGFNNEKIILLKGEFYALYK